MKGFIFWVCRIKHNYYCSDSNYYSNDARLEYTTFADFYKEFHNADVDMNLVFRWDLTKREASDKYFMELFIMKQRKVIFVPIYISYFNESDIEYFIKYINPHMETLKNIWKPFDLG